MVEALKELNGEEFVLNVASFIVITFNNLAMVKSFDYYNKEVSCLFLKISKQVSPSKVNEQSKCIINIMQGELNNM